MDSEDVWLEAARLTAYDKVKSFLAQAVQNMPKSKRLWMLAARKELDPKIKSKILKRALEQLPNEVEIWKECIELEEPEEAKVLLQKAV